MGVSSTCRLLACILLSGASAIHQGPITVKEDGKTLDLHVVALSEKGKLLNTTGNSVSMRWGDQVRAFLALKETDEMPPNNYYNFTLLNKELSYDADLSTVGCSCNAALFFVSMPGYKSDGTVAHGDYNPFYCDANKVGGVWCWEHDTIEANKYTVQTAPHKCVSAPGEYIESCDRAGCGSNAFREDPSGMCPDSRCKIDTRKPFRIFQRYEADASSTKLVEINNIFKQGSNTFEWNACSDSKYLEQMTVAFKGQMSMVFQMWGSSDKPMPWLDGMTGCKGYCNTHTTQLTFSDIQISSLTTAPDAQVLV